MVVNSDHNKLHSIISYTKCIYPKMYNPDPPIQNICLKIISYIIFVSYIRIMQYFSRVYNLVFLHNSIYALRIRSVSTLFMAATFTCASHAAEQLQQQRGRWRRRHLNGATTTMAATTSCLSPTKNAKSMRHNRKSKSINGNDKAREKLIEWQTCKVLV